MGGVLCQESGTNQKQVTWHGLSPRQYGTIVWAWFLHTVKTRNYISICPKSYNYLCNHREHIPVCSQIC